MKLTNRTIFLFDALGAFFSLVFSGLVLPYFATNLGLPTWMLNGFASIAFALFLYSTFCFKFVNNIKPWMLKFIILANLSYCLLTTVIAAFFPGVTSAGIGLLLAEAVIVALVAWVEVQVLRRSFVA